GEHHGEAALLQVDDQVPSAVERTSSKPGYAGRGGKAATAFWVGVASDALARGRLRHEPELPLSRVKPAAAAKPPRPFGSASQATPWREVSRIMTRASSKPD